MARRRDPTVEIYVRSWVEKAAESQATGITEDFLRIDKEYDDYIESAHNDNASVAASSTLTDVCERNEQKYNRRQNGRQNYAPIAESSNEQCSSSSTLGKTNGNVSPDSHVANGVPPFVQNRILNDDAASEVSEWTAICNRNEDKIEKLNSLRGSSDTAPLLDCVTIK